MDLSGHGAFAPAPQVRSEPWDRSAAEAAQTGSRLLAGGWAALQSGRFERLSIYLTSGARIEGVIGLRIERGVCEAATRPGLYTHIFPIADVAMVIAVPRGG